MRRNFFFRKSSKTIYFQQLSKINNKSRVKTALYGMNFFFQNSLKTIYFQELLKIKKMIFFFKKFFFIRIGPNGPIWTPNSRTRFFPDMRFSLNVQEQYALSFKTHFTSDITVRFFTKVQKPHFGSNLSHFWPKRAKPDFFGQNGLRHF